jgi:hypothetical protein
VSVRGESGRTPFLWKGEKKKKKGMVVLEGTRHSRLVVVVLFVVKGKREIELYSTEREEKKDSPVAKLLSWTWGPKVTEGFVFSQITEQLSCALKVEVACVDG